MPPYFSITLQFENKRLKPDFVKEIYSNIISFGFEFKSGYWFHQDANLHEIIQWNQNLLEQGFELGYTQHVKHDYMQILFESEMFSELRGYWMYSEKQITFDMIIPESDILNCEGNVTFNDQKILPIKRLALELWKADIVDAIQTSLELDCSYFNLFEISAGENISANPFAILKEDAYKRFSRNYFGSKIIKRLDNKGVLVESDGTLKGD